jgi:hypothetical protein
MDIDQKQFNQARDNLAEQSLSDTKKQAILSDIYEHGSAPAQSGWILSPFVQLFSARRVLAGALAVVLLLSGTTYAAGSLPGDTLYGMKVNVLEPAALAFQFGQQEETEYRLALLKERVEELKTLKQNSREQNRRVTDDSRQASRKATAKTIAGIARTAAADQKDTRDYLKRKVKTYNRLVGANVAINLQWGAHTSTDSAKNRGAADSGRQNTTESSQKKDGQTRSDDTDDTKDAGEDTTTGSTSTEKTTNPQTSASTSIDTRIDTGDNEGDEDLNAESAGTGKEKGDLPQKETKDEEL